jgi:hypothetical protein
MADRMSQIAASAPMSASVNTLLALFDHFVCGRVQ